MTPEEVDARWSEAMAAAEERDKLRPVTPTHRDWPRPCERCTDANVKGDVRHTGEFCPIYCTCLYLAYSKSQAEWDEHLAAFKRDCGVDFPKAQEPRRGWEPKL